MKNAEIQKMTFDQLVTQVGAEKDAYARLKMAHAISPIENPLRLRQARKLIARLETAISSTK
ncbi:MAG: 50S ribosomal protein L29 [Pseudarcicella sp.]|nr:50S ribosomal protein L29 [Pseudarcicella sp.]MBP6409645.1 50S ribosomal protein L29 [Pseudarcicella sp.]